MKHDVVEILWEQFEERIFRTVCKALQQAPQDAATGKATVDDRLYTKEEICQELDISKTTLTSWMNDNKVPFIRLGRRIYFQKSLVLEAGRAHQKYQRRK
ncbi:helix-turn-helix domain-containing protein [Hymenobacter swuensis]|uniref:helix-turn-helix domain-containing protein n=1 Tax=Hymenobacter swuensis TaxID=1446467 RepID=UPI0009DFDB81|nr:helix-turn-helix domain-containing protein [Hymenobacter swuensis]